MPLVLGIDSSTQSTKVEVRDADSGRLVGHGWAPHPATSPPRSRAGPGDLVASRSSPRGPRPVTSTSIAGDVRRRAAARARRARRGGRGDPAGEALERHRVRARRRLAARPARRRRGGAGRTRAARCRSPRSRSPSSRGCTAPSPRRSPRIARVLLPHDWLAWRLTGELGTDRGDASGTGYWSAATGEYRARPARDRRPRHSTGPPRSRRCSGPKPRPAPATTWPPRSGSGCARATSRSRSAPRARCSRSATRRPPTRPARCAGSRTRPAGTSRSSAR